MSLETLPIALTVNMVKDIYDVGHNVNTLLPKLMFTNKDTKMFKSKLEHRIDVRNNLSNDIQDSIDFFVIAL